MKKVKMIFADGSIKEVDEADVATAQSLGGKLYSETNAKSTSMVFPDGTIRDVDEGDLNTAQSLGAKKKVGGNGIGTPEDVNTTTSKLPNGIIEQGNIDLFAQPSVPNPEAGGESTVWSASFGTDKGEVLVSRVTPDGKILSEQEALDYYKKTGRHLGIFKTIKDANSYADKLHKDYESGKYNKSQSKQGTSLFDNPKLNPLLFKEDVVTTPDGMQFGLTNPTPLGNSPEAIQQLQQRIYNKTATDQDAQILAQASGKSFSATKAYLTQGNNVGKAIEATEDIAKTNADIVGSINSFNQILGTAFNAEEILASPTQSAQLLSGIKNIQNAQIEKVKENQRVQDISTRTGGGGLDEFVDTSNSSQIIDESNKLQNALIFNIKKSTADEARKNGLSDQQRDDLLYQRLDPVGYAENQKLRKPRINQHPNLLYDFADLAMGSEQQNTEALNAEKAQYQLAGNQGLRDLAIEMKAKGIANNDTLLIEEANNLIPKIKEDSEIIESNPMLMKQNMADYINQRYASDAGLLEGTEANDKVNKLQLMFGVNQSLAKKYLQEGGFYDNPAYKDYVDEVATHPTSYLANNSPFGKVGSSFLKPFVSIFNTVGDLTGVRTKADIRAENIKEGMFPEQLTEGIKPDVSIGGFNLNVNNTINSVANLAGYAAIATTTGGLGSSAGLSANAAARLGAWTSFGMEAVDTGLKEADKLGLTPAQSWLFAGMKAVMFAEGGRLLELGKIAIPTIKGVNENLAKAVMGISDKSLSEKAAKEAVDGVANAWQEGLIKYGISTAKGAGVMSGFGVGDSMLKMAFGDENINPNDILPEAANAYVQGLFTMGLFGAVGIKGNIDNARNSTYKGMLSKIVDNHDAAADVLQIGLDKGLFTQAEYNQKLQILNTGIQSKATLNNVIEKNGTTLTPEQKAVWVANATVEKSLRNHAETPDISEADSKNFLKQADNFKEQNTQILDGLTFNKFLEPEIDLYDSRKEHKEALAEFNSNPTPENEKILLNKKEAVDKILFSPKATENVKVEEAPKAEETTKTEVLSEETAPSIEKLKEIKLEVFDENGGKQKYKDVEFVDPVFNRTRIVSAQKAKLELENRHDILTKLIKCLT